jgi:hypothetical protein
VARLYSDQGKLAEAEEMYQRALAGKEKALGPGSHLDQISEGVCLTHIVGGALAVENPVQAFSLNPALVVEAVTCGLS